MPLHPAAAGMGAILIMIPGEYILAEGDIECNAGRRTIKIIVVNTGDRPVQVGSHFHFFEVNKQMEFNREKAFGMRLNIAAGTAVRFEVNKQMEFNREKAFGMRLNIAAGTAVRFEPGEEKEVDLVTFGGIKKIVGFNNLVDGETSLATAKTKAIEKLTALHFKNNTE